MGKRNKGEVGHSEGTSQYEESELQAEHIFNQFGEDIYKLVCFQIKDRGEADDVFQNVFLSLVRRPLPKDTRNIRHFVNRIAMNDIIDAKRKRKSLDGLIERYTDTCVKDTAEVVEDTVEDQLIVLEEVEQICELIETRLHTREAKVLKMDFQEDLTTEKIAKKMGIAKRSVDRYRCTGLRKIREIMATEGYMTERAQGGK